jgi:hypothetical protein
MALAGLPPLSQPPSVTSLGISYEQLAGKEKL